MALARDWIPSPNYSSRGSSVRLIVVHTTQGGGNDTYKSLGNYFANPNSQVSSHVGIDDTPGRVGEYVSRGNKAWTQANANPYCIAAELCAMAEYTSEWDRHPTMLENCALWIAEEAAHFGIPIRKLSSSEAQGGVAGVCGHVDLGSSGGGHWDPGPGFPWDRVMQMAGGAPVGPSAPTPPVSSGPAPPYPGTLLINFTTGHGTRTWQQQMSARGWSLSVDDMYGGESERVCRQFQAEKGLDVDGVVGPQTWNATWNAPIT